MGEAGGCESRHITVQPPTSLNPHIWLRLTAPLGLLAPTPPVCLFLQETNDDHHADNQRKPVATDNRERGKRAQSVRHALYGFH